METILVMTNLPDQDSAERLARVLIEARLAACVNVMAPCSSIYHWRGKTETALEIPVLIKNTAPALQPGGRSHPPAPSL